ncbi:hypothetical protein EW146_g1340 [Bondarzewia mesenterica]|uniref:LNS2/PITP domain-containing protein n=1 Tax=Bondarzewia mesenterica TaxID=1095465 RepID=A0A4S4M478_9AGAM|nr:hypothetical protein EW146_g1340 [Bondarzewia mesenterica]
MNYIWGAVNAISAPYQYYKELPPLNPSTLTGAIDVIVIRRATPEGEYELACSPFHVRFGKWQVLRPAEKKVNVSVNGKPIPFKMKIGDAGEAFFIFETEGDVPDDLITSPLLEATKPGESDAVVETVGRFGAKGTEEPSKHPGEEREEEVQEPDFLDLNASDTPELTTPPAESSSTMKSPPRPSGLSLSKPVPENSDSSEASQTSNILGRTAGLGKAVVHAVVETAKEKSAELQDGALATRNIAANMINHQAEQSDAHVSSPDDQGDEALPPIKPEDLQSPEVMNNGDVMIDMAGYHSQRRPPEQPRRHEGQPSAIPFPLSSSPDRHTPETRIQPPSLRTSTSPNQPIQFPTIRSPSAPPIETPQHHAHHASTLDSSSSPLPDEYMWEWGAFPQRSPMRTTFPKTTRSKIAAKAVGAAGDIAEMSGESDLEEEEEGHAEFQRSKSLPPALDGEIDVQVEGPSEGEEEPRSDMEKSDEEPISDADAEPDAGKRRMGATDAEQRQIQNADRTSWAKWWRRSAKGRTQSMDMRSEEGQNASVERKMSAKGERPVLKAHSSVPLQAGKHNGSSSTVIPDPDPSARDPSIVSAPASLPGEDTPLRTHVPAPVEEAKDIANIRFAKTLRLTSDQLKTLDLHLGANTITFSLSASGVAACTARIFVWESTDHIVVSDIDGTITKSDALGHVFTMIGRDWTHLGVAKLYTDICRNGYKIMYLTSRAIGQADSTRYYLQGIKQNDYQLPEGPVIMSPDRLMASLHREVIMRKPEVFKMACLRDIQRLFGPMVPNPFYAGFGNRITDALSYRSVNIPSSRIFTIDSNGEVKMELLELAGYKSPSVQSYIHMTDLVDQMFPPIQHKWESEFTDNTYWKAPMAEYPLPDLAPPSPALSARSDTSNQSALARLRNFSLRSSSGKRLASLPPPATDPRRGRNMVDGREPRLRQMSSLERLSSTLSGLAPRRSVSPESSSGTYLDSEEDAEDGEKTSSGRRRRARTRSVESMPGSLPGSKSSSEQDEDELEFGAEGSEDEGYEADEAEVAEQEFDEDLLATGEMESVPFL